MSTTAQAKQSIKFANMRQRAQKMIDDGEKDFGRDRLSNTHRRASQAAHAEKNALAKVAVGKLLLKIADSLEIGDSQALIKVSGATEIDLLNNLLQRCKQRHKIALKESWNAEYVFTEASLEYAQMPYGVLYKSNVFRDLSVIAESEHSGTTKVEAAKRLVKALENIEDDYLWLNSTELIADFKCTLGASDSGSYYKRIVEEYERTLRLGFTDLDKLKEGLRQFLSIKNSNVPREDFLKKQKLREMERSFIGKKYAGFFPTPKELAERIVGAADIKEGDSILEPSAGLGSIADVIKEKYDGSVHLTCVEVNYDLKDILLEKGYRVIHGDFLEMKEDEIYDKIVMNPPFENLLDIDHVYKAYKMLKEGGTLVSIMGAKNYNDSRQKVLAFLHFVKNKGQLFTNPEGSFKSAFNPTGVSTVTVILNK